ncbi:9578_t:CDS:2, partial [Racocetra persica]
DSNKLISNLGRIKNNKGVVLKGNVCKRSGYIQIDLSINSIRTSTGIPILVAQAFISNPENKPYINHINSIKHDNRAVNLEWVTPKENAEHKIFLNRDHGSSRRIVQKTLDGNVIRIWNSICLADNTLKVLENKILEYCNRKRDTAGAFCPKEKGKEFVNQIDVHLKPQDGWMRQCAIKQIFDDGSFREFPSLIKAQHITGIDQSSISKVCRGYRTYTGRYH